MAKLVTAAGSLDYEAWPVGQQEFIVQAAYCHGWTLYEHIEALRGLAVLVDDDGYDELAESVPYGAWDSVSPRFRLLPGVSLVADRRTT